MTVLWSGQPADYRDDELELVDDYDPEPDLLDDLDDWMRIERGRCGTSPTPNAPYPGVTPGSWASTLAAVGRDEVCLKIFDIEIPD